MDNELPHDKMFRDEIIYPFQTSAVHPLKFANG